MEPSQGSDSRTVIKITDAHLNDLYSNQTLAALSGYSAEELEQIGWVNIIDPQAHSLFEEIIRAADRVPYVRECFETNVICRDGSTRTLAWQVISLSRDQFPLMLITAQESAQQQSSPHAFVRKRQVVPISSNLWEEIFNALPDCVSIHDENYTIVAANTALCERLGTPKASIVGHKCHEVFHGQAQPVEHCVLVRAMSGKPGERVRRESYEHRFRGAVQAEAVAFTSGKSGLRGVVHTLRTADSFDLGIGAASRRELDSLSRLANAVAHDYNNLLSGIVGYTGMLQMVPDLNERAKRYVQELQNAAARLNEMTQRLLMFGRKRVLQKQTVDLNRVVADTLESPELVSDEQERTIVFEKAGESVETEADPYHIGVAVKNLITNALEASATADGNVTVRTLRRKQSQPFATFFAVAPAGEYACVEVRDTGLGMDGEQLVHAFEPFSQPQSRPTGRGLGLAIVYRIVHNHHGFIEADSERGIGTRISILLPANTAIG
jgi:PAS domain S-box-containing protein